MEKKMKYRTITGIANIVFLILGFLFSNALFSWALKEPVSRHMFWICVLHLIGFLLIQISAAIFTTKVLRLPINPNQGFLTRMSNLLGKLVLIGLPFYKTWHSAFSAKTIFFYLLGATPLALCIVVPFAIITPMLLLHRLQRKKISAEISDYLHKTKS